MVESADENPELLLLYIKLKKDVFFLSAVHILQMFYSLQNSPQRVRQDKFNRRQREKSIVTRYPSISRG